MNKMSYISINLEAFLFLLFLIIQVHKLHYKGAKIFNVIVKDLLAKGMKNASNVSDIYIHMT